MPFANLPTREEQFRRTGNGGEYILRPLAVPVPNEPLTLNGVLCTPAKRSGYYHDTVYTKERIVLHFTAGSLTSDMNMLTRQNYHVSVPFVIARDGTIYQLYSSTFWSGNLGGDAVGNARNDQDKRTIGIEISNFGPLHLTKEGLQTIYGELYCPLTLTGAYQKLDVPFRNESYFATYTDVQYDSLVVLLRYLTAKYSIPRQFLPEPKRYLTTNDVLSFKGIVTHVNYRASGKWDIGPAFNWPKVIAGVQASTFLPALRRDIEVIDGPVLSSEEAILPLLPEPGPAILEDETYDEPEPVSANASTPESATTVYSLIVGIDNYHSDVLLQGKVKFPALRGCVHDAMAVQTYLETSPAVHVTSRLLTNEAATKAAIVDAFQTHLAQAKAGEVALFYFSGHGTQEWADSTVWTSETDGRLECLACYYDSQTADNFLLADKELRYLIGQLANSKPIEERPQIVLIFDCCHSGDNTRNGELMQTAFADVAERRIPFSFKQRTWDQFIFGQTISEDKIRQLGVDGALPEGTHVQLSACESDESALEVGGEGVFTKTLLNVVRQAGGPISYYSLRSRVRQYLRNVFEQRPRIYVANGDDALLYGNFLNQPGQSDTFTTGEIVYGTAGNSRSRSWSLNRGAIHGVTTELGTFSVTAPTNPSVTYRARVKTVQIDHADIVFDDPAPTDLTATYLAVIPGLMARPIAIFVNHQHSSPAEQKELMDGLLAQTVGYIDLQDEELKADYVIQNWDGRYYITQPNDPFRPLTQPVDAGTETTMLQLANQLRHLSQWTFLEALTNAGSNALPDGTLQVDCVRVNPDGTEVSVLNADRSIAIQYQKDANDVWRSAFRMKITNPTSVRLYCAVLYLDTEFQSFPGLLNPTTYLLEPGNSVYLGLKGKDVIKSRLPAVMQAYNWESRIECLKLIVSTDEFDAQALMLSPLPEPPLPGQPKEGDHRGGLLTDDDEQEIALTGWGTQQYSLKLINPEFNRISSTLLEAMLSDLQTAPFGLGLYFDAVVTEDWQVEYKLKEGIALDGSSSVSLDERGFISGIGLTLANTVARKLRNNHFRRVIDQFPDRIRMVSEGDSWFQHPLVTDVIDHLGRVYAIHCVAAAGDTLRNMQRMGQYLSDIDEQQPSFFLLSGGGNDILGEQFRTYLKENPDMSGTPGENPRRFLKDELFIDLNSLRDVYETIFTLLKTKHPDLHILVHGYDYIIPLSVTNKGWLGRYMIEKGINRQEDRQAVISFILNEFNSRMQLVAASFSNVSYINALRTVRPNQWYDEIHPNSDGFQQVAMKFMKRINEVLALRPA